MVDFEAIGSVIYDIFCGINPEKLPDYERFKSEIESQGAKVVYDSRIGRIRVHNDDKTIPTKILEIADNWANKNLLDHAYR